MSRRAIADNSDGDRLVAEWMRRAIDIARDTQPHPNPRVGAVVVSPNGELLAEAAHRGPGEPHAEAAALAAAGSAAAGGSLYVTLEPCDHDGRTPPCTVAIVESGVSTVYVGAFDPDDRVSGRGIERLRDAGIRVEECRDSAGVTELDPGYFHHRRTGRPRVTLKLAATLDGQTAAEDGTSQWITSAEARVDAHLLRARSDAVMVGAGTLRADDPRLDARDAASGEKQPRPVIVGGRSPLPESARVYERNPLIYSPQRLGVVPDGVELEVMWDPAGVDLDAMMKDLGGRGIVDLLVEGGATLGRALLDANLVDHLVVYLAASLAGGSGRPMFDGIFRTLHAVTPLEIVSVRRVGPDLRIDAVPASGEA